MNLSIRDRKILWAKAGNRCSFRHLGRVCRLPLAQSVSGEHVVLGVECHIVGDRQGSARYQADFPTRETYANAILMCGAHHKMIDDAEATFTVALLQKMKSAHEAAQNRAISGGRSVPPRRPPGSQKPVESEPYVHRRYLWSTRIADESGQSAFMQHASCLKVRPTELREGGTWWSTYPHGLKTYLAYGGPDRLPSRRVEIAHGEPEKRGSLYFWPHVYDPPVRKGQTFWVIDEFELRGEYGGSRICDFFDSLRPVGRITWRFMLPPERPALRWHGSADYLANERDRKVLAAGTRPTTRVEWDFTKTQLGATYYLTIDW